MDTKYALKTLLVGSGSIIGKDNIKEFFNHVSKHEEIENRSIAELAPDYETAAAQLVKMLEARFVNLHPVMQHMFLNLHEAENNEKRDFILETLFKEFKDIVVEARKVFAWFDMLGSSVDVISALEPKLETRMPTPLKLVGLHDALEKNFDWVIPENLFDESSKPKSNKKGASKTNIDKIQAFVEAYSVIDFDALSLEDT